VRKYNGKNNPNYIDGRSLKDYFCSCGNKIHSHTALYGTGKCLSCTHSGKKNGNYGIHKLGKNNPNWKGIEHKCIDCGKKVTFMLKDVNLVQEKAKPIPIISTEEVLNYIP